MKLKGVSVLEEDHKMEDIEFMEKVFEIRMEIDEAENHEELLAI